MKKNMLTIILIALSIVNVTLTAVIVFAVVPTANQTRNLVTKVTQSLDLELESQEPEKELQVEDLEVYTLEDQLTVNLASEAGDSKSHYALFSLSITMDKTASDYSTKYDLLASYDTFIKEIVTEEFSNYTVDGVTSGKDEIKTDIVAQLNELLGTECIVSVSFGNIVLQ